MSKKSVARRTYARVDLQRIEKNLKLLAGYARPRSESWAGAVPMVKCNAYGHGIAQVGRALEKNSDTLALGVATLDEAIQLREAKVRKPVWVFSDSLPFTEDRLGAFHRYKLTAIVHAMEDVRIIAGNSALSRKARKVDFHIKFNTGMNRLGIAASECDAVLKLLQKAKARPSGIAMHFAAPDATNTKLTSTQAELFRVLAGRWSGVSYIHGSSTRAILSEDQLEMGRFCNVIRPGIGIYGYGGSEGDRLGLKPALEWLAQVVEVRSLKAGDNVGYGATYTLNKLAPQAIIALGYGDGLRRGLSNSELLIAKSAGETKPIKVQGRVSMDLASLEMKVKRGEWVTLLGKKSAQGEHMARMLGTVVYEILTGISERVPRVHV
jgi:alanine racemase